MKRKTSVNTEALFDKDDHAFAEYCFSARKNQPVKGFN